MIAIFDKEFIQLGKMDRQYSKILHRLFNLRQEGDYKELTVLSTEDSEISVRNAEEFVSAIKSFISNLPLLLESNPC